MTGLKKAPKFDIELFWPMGECLEENWKKVRADV